MEEQTPIMLPTPELHVLVCAEGKCGVVRTFAFCLTLAPCFNNVLKTCRRGVTVKHLYSGGSPFCTPGENVLLGRTRIRPETHRILLRRVCSLLQ